MRNKRRPVKHHGVPLTIRAGTGRTLLLQASNDRVVDHYGTVITAEALMRDWWEGYQQHRTVSLQHNLPELRGIPGAPNIGHATRVDFTPQLEVEVQVRDDAVMDLVRSGKLQSASLEFLPAQTERREYAGADDAHVYHRLSSEPEHCGLSIVDVPGVPGSDLLSLRSLPPLWAFAVVDPLVINGEITDPAVVNKLAWFPHHNEFTHEVDEKLLARAVKDLTAGNIDIPPEASLSRAQIISRARAHLERHTNLGLGRRTTRAANKEASMNKKQWIAARTALLEAEGLEPDAAQAQAETDYAERHAKDDKAGEQQEAGLLARIFGAGRRVNISVDNDEPATPVVETRAEQPSKPVEKPAEPSKRAAPEPSTEELEKELELRIERGVEAKLAELAKLPENPMAAIAAGIKIRGGKLEPEELLGEVLKRTVVPQLMQQSVTADARQEVENMLTAHGLSARALTIEGNGVVIYEEMARQFSVKPMADVFFRNHFRTLPMTGTKKTSFPTFDAQGLSFEWNRATQGGSTSDISDSDPTLGEFTIEVTELNGSTTIADSFLHFNASGPTFVQESLLPQLRAAAQAAEDRAFWLSTGSHPSPSTFKGFRHATGVTDGNPGATAGEEFSEALLSRMLRALPMAFRKNNTRLAFYLPMAIADDFAEIRAARATALGDSYAEDRYGAGPAPVGRYRGIPVFGVGELPVDETVGSDHDTSTAYLVHRDVPAIGDGLSIRIEPHRIQNFQTRIQLQEFVGLGYDWPTGIVRYSGIQARDS